MLKREDVEAFLCSHSFSFMVDILSDFIWDITEAVSDSDQLSKGCLKVKERETFICDLLHQCQCCNTGEQSPAGRKWCFQVVGGQGCQLPCVRSWGRILVQILHVSLKASLNVLGAG